MRGGISMIVHRHAKANNSLMTDYNPAEANSYILYPDANNLYGWAMSKPLPAFVFEWMQDSTSLNVLEVPDDVETEYLLEAYLEYPSYLQDLHNDYPLAPESMKISPEMLSPYSQQLAEKPGPSGTVEKLVPNLQTKHHYVFHYRNLKLYLELGLKMVKIHRVLQFKQEPWLKPYIDLNTRKRAQAKNAFEKDFYKLMNNSVFGKTMENVRRHINVDLVTSPLKFKKLVKKATYQRSKTFIEDGDGCLIAVNRQQVKVVMKKPVYTGFAVLDLSKVLMYQFHYLQILVKYGADNARLLFTDTDSLMYHMITTDVYADMLTDLDKYDTSDYLPEHPLHSNANKKVIGKFKDETSGSPIREFIGLREKNVQFPDG